MNSYVARARATYPSASNAVDAAIAIHRRMAGDEFDESESRNRVAFFVTELYEDGWIITRARDHIMYRVLLVLAAILIGFLLGEMPGGPY